MIKSLTYFTAFKQTTSETKHWTAQNYVRQLIQSLCVHQKDIYYLKVTGTGCYENQTRDAMSLPLTVSWKMKKRLDKVPVCDFFNNWHQEKHVNIQKFHILQKMNITWLTRTLVSSP